METDSAAGTPAGSASAGTPAGSAAAVGPADPAGSGSRAEMIARLGSRRTPLTPSEIRAATRRLQPLDAPTIPLRLAVLRTYTTELLAPYWRFEAPLQGLDLHLYEAPFGSLRQEA